MVFLNRKLLNLSKLRSFSVFISNPSPIYTNEHRALQQSLQKIIDKDINPFVDEWEKKKIFPAKKLFKTLGTAGFFGINKPIEYGGMGLDYTYHIAFAEQLGNIRCMGVPMAIGVQSSMITPALLRFGSDKLKNEFLRPTIAGDLVGCLGVSETEAGSDVAAIKTKARIDGDDLVIDGGKMWITNGAQADWICLLANTSQDGNQHENKSLICVPMNTSGVKVVKNIDKMGNHCSDTTQIFFENVRVPRNHIIGEMNRGFVYQMMQFQEERLFGIAAALLALENVIKETLEYTSQRKVFGKPLIANQIITFTMAELLSELECVRSLLYRTVHSYTYDNADVTLLASIGKLKIGRLSREITDKCLQFWGGTGYVSEMYINRMHRDFRLLSIGAGADEVMLAIICKYMLKTLQ